VPLGHAAQRTLEVPRGSSPARCGPCRSRTAKGGSCSRTTRRSSASASGQVALRYVTADGGAAQYPELPNGSTDAIAGLCDSTGRVLGLMPHPERNLSPWNHPRWTRMGPREAGEGLEFYRRLVEAAAR
jgi:phosphoribosylformylglycinamidine (FGAM) synthase-like amidotransferase family enzyme